MSVMLLADRALAAIACQLGQPTGFAGRVVGRLLNRGNRSVVIAAIDAADVAVGSVVADIGFGGGVGLDVLLQRVGAAGSVHGVEMSPTMLAEAGRRFSDDIADGRLRLHEGRMENLPLPDTSLDAIISTNTIYFVEELATALRELVRVLRPTGRLVLGVGDPDQMSKMPFTRHGFRLRPMEQVIDAIREAGFARVDDRRVGDGPMGFHILVCVKVL
ncbi:class I SAM-dependent methyltransferase [Antrihabitans cavernicola]|uniref:Class I SAM-dependent methyltransferase n=1 Tax=Antrihabitans cavernicola TaxID=2495913 RepID=A0A5A7SED4_9NOCA|nr:class I SAM-dependent methyltransferase [Spelaeibacter cavernicola]KAA0023944.1 class I SAM-dependent methyltransferase [Spelaeibacter cavernicola]